MRKKTVGIAVCLMLIVTLVTTNAMADENQAPEIPTLDGPITGKIGILYEFTATTTDPEGDYIAYNFSWGEGNYSGWIMPFVESGESDSASFSWSELGAFNVTVKAKDVYGAETGLSDPLIITIENDPPETPTIDGPTGGAAGVLYTYTFVTTDPNEDDVSYYIDWGDGTNSGWMPFSASGETATDAHLWSELGEYNITIKAKDSFEDESGWSDPLTVHISVFDISINGGIGVSLAIKNNKNESLPGNFVNWEISLVGGTFPGFHMNKHFSGREFIEAGATEIITVSMFALGRLKITATIKCAGEPTVTKTVDAFALFFYVIIQ